MIKLTRDQERAIFDRGSSLLVSAAAGSGKTMVLVDRVVRLILEEKIDIDRMLIVTFTNAAANQMKVKIREKLVNILYPSHEFLTGLRDGDRSYIKNLSADDKKFIRKQVELINEANISTMHSFCIKLLRDYYEHIGLSPTFKIANPAREAVISTNALEACLEEEYREGREDFIKVFDYYARSNEDILGNLIRDMYYKVQSQLKPMAWLKDQVDREKSIEDPLKAYILDQLNISKELNKSIRKMADVPMGPLAYLENLDMDKELIEGLIDDLRNKSFDEFIGSLSQASFSRLKTIRANDESIDHDLKDRVKEARDDIKDSINDLKAGFINKTSEQINKENLLARAYLSTIQRMVESYDKNLLELKREENVLGFSDLEHLSLELLEIQDVRDKVQSKLAYIFYDEYQDINPLQEAIIERIARPDNLFFVGDIKQSIYKFRLADPRLFNKRYDLYKNSCQGKIIDLDENFRSSPVLVRFLNSIFKDLMTKDLGDVDYKEVGQALVTNKDEDGGRAIVVINEEDPLKNFENLKANPKFIAEEINRLVAEGYDYRDMVILMRNARSNIGNYESALDKYGIPYFTDVSMVSLEDPEVAIFIDMLRLVNNYRDDKALLSVLLTPFGDMDENDLAAIRAESPGLDFHEAMDAYEGDQGLRHKIKNFKDKLGFYRKKLWRMTLSDFAYYLASDTAYLSYLQMTYKGDEKVQNLLAFIERIEAYEESSYSSLGDFLAYVQTLLKSPSDSLEPTKLLSEADNVVRLMTIHKSKGLEFKIVFMTEMDRDIRLHEKRDGFIVDDNLGIGGKVYDEDLKSTYRTAHRKLVEVKQEKEMMSEEVRLFYVGTTRAEKVLYLVGSTENPGKYLEKMGDRPLDIGLVQARSMMDWYTNILIRAKDRSTILDSSPENSATREAFEKKYGFSFLLNPYSRETRDFIDYADVKKFLGQANTSNIEKLDRIMTYKYAYEKETKLAYKTTVSEISRKNINKTDDTADFPKIYVSESPLLSKLPDVLCDGSGLSPMARGDLIHFIFQHLSYKDHNIDSIREEIKALVAKDLILSNEVQGINEEIFLNFFKSGLGQRAIENVNNLHREKSFTMSYGDIFVDGQIDAYFLDGDGIVMYDFKSDSTISERRYLDQMRIYKEALEQAQGLAVKEVYIYWTSFNKITEIKF